jgi:hypothetical protein
MASDSSSVQLVADSTMGTLSPSGRIDAGPFEVTGIAGHSAAQIPEGDGYLAALVNFQFMANAVWTTEEAVHRLSK